MGFVNEYIEIRIGRKAKYWKSLGYVFDDACNKNETMITVKTADLSKGSHHKIDYCCDECGKIIFGLDYSNYAYHNHDGKYYCVECAAKLFRSGKKHYKYDEEKSDFDREQERKTPENALFKKMVYTRDKGLCQICGARADVIHHLDGWNWCVEKRYDVSNGICLCDYHHKAFHTKYGLGNNTKEQFLEFANGIELNLSDFQNLPERKQVYHFESNTIFDSYEDAARELSLNKGMVRDVCCGKAYTTKHQHFKYYTDYLKMTKEEVNTYISINSSTNCSNRIGRYRDDPRIVLLNTMDIGTTNYMSKKYNIPASTIAKVLCGNRSYLNTYLYNNTPMVFVYYEDYITMSDDDINKRLRKYLIPKEKTLVCITTGNIFLHPTDAKIFANLKDIDPIYVCCRHSRGITYAGKLCDGTKLQWIYWKEFVHLSIQEQKQILKLNSNNNVEELLEYSSFLLQKLREEETVA